MDTKIHGVIRINVGPDLADLGDAETDEILISEGKTQVAIWFSHWVQYTAGREQDTESWRNDLVSKGICHQVW